VTDDCGNSINVFQSIIVNDDILPTASNPATITIQCITDLPVPDPLAVIDETDNCSIPTVAFVSDVSDNQTCPETITRTYSVTDDCGNSINVTQSIIVNDDILPTASNPAPITVQCFDDIPAPDPLVVTDEADNCSIPVIAFVTDIFSVSSCPATISRIYSITDDCGNSINVTQTIIVDDDILPTASDPESITVQCIGDVPAPDPSVVNDEADNCSVPSVVFVSDVSDNQSCPETISRTYRVTDDCGNSINVTQTIIVDDDILPTASDPVPITVQCIGDVPEPDPAVVTNVFDNCSLPLIEFVSDVSDNQTCPEIITRTYSVTDDCGNSINVTQSIIVNDDILPTASDPASIMVQCIDDVPAPNPGVITDASDNCSLPFIEFVSDVSDNQTCPETITRTYSVTDDCGNTINVVQLIIVNDDILPTASDPAPITVQCIGDVPVPDPSVVSDEADNCSVPTVTHIFDEIVVETCPMLILRTYRVTDTCGNSIDVTQNINVNDDILPTASNPEPITVQCIDEVPSPDTNVVTDETDNCSIPTVEFVSDVSDNQSCPETITRTYSVTDDCGNFINVTQLIIIIDDIPPTASDPEPITVQCFDEVPQPDIGVITDAADNCSIPVVSFVSDVSDNQTCLETITRTYSVTDDCGNSILVIQEIMIIDETPPEVITPYYEEFYVICGEIPEVPNLEFVDNCSSEVFIEFDETEDNIDEYNYDIIRTWTVTDECDNTQEFTQLIYVRRDYNEDEFSISLCVGDDPIDLTDFIVNTPFTDGEWEGNIITSTGNIIDPSSTPLGDHVFTYTYSENECVWITIVNVNINDNCVEYPCIESIDDVVISKLVSANNDGINDFFEVDYILDQRRSNFCNIRINLEFFNRWGVKVFDEINYSNDWDGSYTSGMLGSYDKLPTGTYYYIVTLENSGLDPIQGYILLGTN